MKKLSGFFVVKWDRERYKRKPKKGKYHYWTLVFVIISFKVY